MAFSSYLIMCLHVFLMCFVLMTNGAAYPQPIKEMEKIRVCREIDARNDPWNLEVQLRGCNIVIGSVSIVLIERNNATFDINNVSFPELREITGYLLFFRVFKLESLRSLFPNLSVIRGDRLILHYALIIHEMPDLREIGLISLIKILRGLVMIRMCPMLCYAKTIDWNIITQPHAYNGLGNYLGYDSNDACPTAKSCSSVCSNSLCWNNQYCQLFDIRQYITKENRNVECHEECIGGCEDSTPNTCKVCRNYRIMLSEGHKTCVEKCPEDLYIYNSFCVDAAYCKRQRKLPVMGECRQYCDKMIDVNVTDASQCVRSCGAVEVDSLSASDLVRGCQVIRGDLFIRIQSGVVNTMQYLERNLGDIEEIEGILKVTRSPVITSLNFLRNLRIIRGFSIEKPKYTIVIMSNENLQELWDFNEKKELQLDKGNLQIHFNSKLCLTEIRQLQTILKTNTSEDFIGLESNGYEQSCSTRTIATWHKIVNHTCVEISWEKIKLAENEKIMGYIIYYIVAPDRNVTHRGIDTCVQYGWQTYFIQNITMNASVPFHTAVISNLTQNTQYAYYVKTQVVPTINEELLSFTSQGQSNIEYFTTDADVPSPPLVQTYMKSHNSLTLSWHPIMDNELIDFYKVDYFIQPDEHEFLDSRDYCLNPRVEVNIGFEASESPVIVQQSCYENWKSNHPDAEDPEYEWEIYRKAECAEQAARLAHRVPQLQIMKFIEKHKKRGCVGSDCVPQNDFDSLRFSRKIHDFVTGYGGYDKDNSEPNLGANYIGKKQFPSNVLNATFTDLLPYTVYVFQYFSCRKPNNCSSYSLHYDRTDVLTSADNVHATVVIDPNNSNRVHLDFAEPEHPNGLTVAFEVENNDLNIYTVTTYCITRKQHYDNGKRYTFEHLDRGRYIFRVRSISLAQVGEYTNYNFVVVYDQSPVGGLSFGTSMFLFIIFVLIAVPCIIYLYCRLKIRLGLRNLTASTQNIMIPLEETSWGSRQDEGAPSFYQQHQQKEEEEAEEVF